tara:strand:+ start:1741 stop:2382 length:642 start_codon:yes stop_codon:yes gene_type:complete
MLYNRTFASRIFFEDKPISSASLYEKEKELFKEQVDWTPISPYTFLDKEQINTKETVELIKKHDPEVIFTFGCSLLKEEVFSIPKYGCINIHTGIVQLFRGVDSAFWAVHDENLDGVGATLHYIDKSIDAGEIIAQKKADIAAGDDIEDLFLKSCIAGFEVLKDSLADIKKQTVSSFVLKNKGKLYQIKDRTPEAEQEVASKIDRVIEEYLSD